MSIIVGWWAAECEGAAPA